jgi:hypothetical protein
VRQSEGMPASLILARYVLGFLCIAFAHLLGRSAAKRGRPPGPNFKVFSWTLRTLIAALGMTWLGGLDAFSIIVLTLSLISLAAGVYLERRPQPAEEDLTHVIFPEDEGSQGSGPGSQVRR